jgi:SAM-dependent methyltransferase
VGRDQDYLRQVQYRDPAKLTARADLHTKYGTAAVGWFAWLLGQIDWPATGQVLEVGCGPGWLWAEDSVDLPGGLSLTLTDLSSGMLAAAADRARASSRIAVVDARVADAQQLPFDDDVFDVVVANHMLYHVPEPETAVTEFARVLRSDGVLMAATNGPRHLRQLWEIRSAVFGGAPTSVHPDLFGSVTGAPILGRGFSRVEWRPYEDVLRCTDPDDVVAFLTSAPPGEDASAEHRDELRRMVQDRCDAGGGVFTVSKETGVFLADQPRHHRPGRTSEGGPT